MNMLDGMVALASGKASPRGEILNDLPDRISDILIFAGVAHSGLIANPFFAYWAMIFALLTAYVGTLGQAVGARREFGGVMSKPWRMVTLHVGAWITLGAIWFHCAAAIGPGRLTILDYTCLIVIVGCIQTIAVRLSSIMQTLRKPIQPESGGMMSPAAALDNHVFRVYVYLVVGVLIAAGGLLAFLQFVLRKILRSIWLTYKGWLIMIPLIGLTIFLGRWAVITGVTLLSIFGFKEFARASGLYRDWWMTGTVYIAIIAVGISSLMHDPFTHLPGWFGLFRAMPVYAICLLVIIPVLRNVSRGQLQELCRWPSSSLSTWDGCSAILAFSPTAIIRTATCSTSSWPRS